MNQALLLVEDNELGVITVRAILQNFNISTYVAHSLDEACQLCTSLRFDACILDLNLPDSRGLDTIVSFKKFAPNTPVVVISGIIDEKVAEISIEEGATAFLLKPVKADDVINAVAYALRVSEGRIITKRKEKKMHKGKVVFVTQDSITMMHDDGLTQDERKVEEGATITLDGKAVKLHDLRAGDMVDIEGDPATTVIATRKVRAK